MRDSLTVRRLIVRRSFYCGLATFLVNAALVLSGIGTITMVTACVLPGFSFAIVICDCAKSQPPFWRQLLFALCSGVLYLLVWLLLVDDQINFQSTGAFVLASVLNFLALLMLYWLLVNAKFHFWKALLLGTIFGGLSAVLPALVFSGYLAWLGNAALIISVMSIFLTWQTLFGLTIAWCSPLTEEE